MDRPILTLDLQGPEGNVFVVIGRARRLLSGSTLAQYNTDIGNATLVNAGVTYPGILAIINHYVRLIDRSGLYPEYGVNQEEVIVAIDHFNEQLQTLPSDTPCSLEDLYPDFDDPDRDAYTYLALVTTEIASVERQIEQCSEDEKGLYERLLTMLRECASALERAGIG